MTIPFPYPEMKIYLLQPRLACCIPEGPFAVPGTSWCYGYVIQAPHELAARVVADNAGLAENRWKPGVKPWIDSAFTTCKELQPDPRVLNHSIILKSVITT